MLKPSTLAVVVVVIVGVVSVLPSRLFTRPHGAPASEVTVQTQELSDEERAAAATASKPSPATATQDEQQQQQPVAGPVEDGGSDNACSVERPATPGTPFPCNTRITKFNSMEFFKWPPEEEQRKRQLLAPILKRCSGIDPAARPSLRPTSEVKLVGCSGLSGRWARCWIVPQYVNPATNISEPACMMNDVLDVKMDSPNAKIAVDRVLDLENGVHEIVFYVRKRGTYTICVDMYLFHQWINPPHGSLLMGRLEQAPVPQWTGAPVPLPNGTPVTPKFPLNARCFSAEYTSGIDIVPMAVPCAATTDPDRFRYGGWYRFGATCDGVHCTGSGGNMEGWLWVTDVCVLHLYSLVELHRMLNTTWVVGWGGSTMKQPMSNFVEYYMHRPIFQVFMAHLDRISNKNKRKPNFFSYRQWDIVAQNESMATSTRWTMSWGGCPGLVQGPGQCQNEASTGMGFYRRQELLWGPQSNRRNISAAIAHVPTALLIDHYVWRFPQDTNAAYLAAIRKLVSRIRETLKQLNHTSPPMLLLFHLPPVGHNGLSSVRPPGLSGAVEHASWVQHDMITEEFRNDLLIIDRTAVTRPLHFGDDFAHFGVHYGASEGMCNTGHARSERYAFANCLRKTWADDAVIWMWLNAIDAHMRAAAAAAADRASADGGGGVGGRTPKRPTPRKPHPPQHRKPKASSPA